MYFLTFLLIVVTLLVLAWSYMDRSRFFQFPFLLAGIYLIFAVPQVIALTNSEQELSTEWMRCRLYIMAILCLIGGFVGYQQGEFRVLRNLFRRDVNETRLFHVGALFLLINQMATYMLERMPEADLKNTQWTGTVTKLHFFAHLAYPAMSIFMILVLRRPTVLRFLLVAATLAPPVKTILFAGRREVTALLLLTVGLMLHFYRQFRPPRLLVTVVLLFTPLLMLYFGENRKIYAAGSKIVESETVTEYYEKFKATLDGTGHLELRNAAFYMQAIVDTGRFGMGTTYWDSLVFRFVPAQYVGRELKASLQFHIVPSPIETLNSLYGYKPYTGVTYTGFSDSFADFHYFGCMVFFMIARFYKTLWVSSTRDRSPLAQVFYANLSASGMICVTHGTTMFLPDFLYVLLFFGTAAFYCSKSDPGSVMISVGEEEEDDEEDDEDEPEEYPAPRTAPA